MNYILPAATILICTAVYYLLNRYNKRNYYKGYRIAYKYASLMPLSKESLSNIKNVLDSIFHDALGEITYKLENNLSIITKRIIELEELISNNLKSKEIASIEMLKISKDDLDISKYNESCNTIQENINRLIEKDKDLRNKLSGVEKIYITESSKDKTNKPIESNSWIKITTNKIIQLNKEFSSLWFFLVLIVLDYFLAVSFFKDIADTGDATTDIILGYLLPLAVTFISMLLIQMIKGGYKKIRSRNSDINNYIYLSLISVLLFIIVAFIIFYRISTSQNPIIDSLLGILFVSLIVVASHYIEKEGRDATFLIAAPIKFLIFFIEIVFISIFWIFENIYSFISQNKSTIELVSYRDIKNIEEEMKINQKELNEKSYSLRVLKEKIEKYKEDYVDTAKKQIQLKIDKTEQNVSNSQNELSNLKNKEISLNKFLNDIREGSNDGTMAALSKKQF